VTSGTTDIKGRVILNIGNFDSWNAGDSVSITAVKVGKGTKTETLILTSSPQSLEITLEETSEYLIYDNNSRFHVLNFAVLALFDGTIVDASHPLPVTHGEIDLINNPSTVWSITRTDGQPDYEEVTIRGEVYRRTFTFNSSGVMIQRSAWVRQ